MTQIGKCDTCRQRKVKCDEKRPRCGACGKRDRPCTYTYGKASAMVLEDPNQLTRHGKPKVTPRVYPLTPSDDDSNGNSSTEPDFRLTMTKDAENGQGIFQTFALTSQVKTKPRRKVTEFQRRRLQEYLLRLKAESTNILLRPSSHETRLISRYMSMIGNYALSENPMSIFGSWVTAVPSRIGTSNALDFAVEYAMDGWDVLWNDTFSKRKEARTSKAKALKMLQLAIEDGNGTPSYDIVLAMKMHFCAEIFLGVMSLYHTIHAAGILDMLKSGELAGADGDLHWQMIDDTYIDDVSEAMLAGRTSVFDNDHFLSITFPPNLIGYCLFRRVSGEIMHSFIQVPRLICLVRHALNHPDDLETLASAICLVETLWKMHPFDAMQQFLEATTTTITTPPTPDIADIISDSLHFDSIQSMTVITRFWMLQNELCALTLNLHERYPAQVAMSPPIPDIHTIQNIDIQASMGIARSVLYCHSISGNVPLVPLRLGAPLQLSLGSWHRRIQRITRAQNVSTTTSASEKTDIDFDITHELNKAQRMEDWVLQECNRVHKAWSIPQLSKAPIIDALGALCGGPIPHWMPIKLSFENEQGDMIMRLDYDMPTLLHKQVYSVPQNNFEWTRSTKTLSPFGLQDRRRWEGKDKAANEVESTFMDAEKFDLRQLQLLMEASFTGFQSSEEEMNLGNGIADVSEG